MRRALLTAITVALVVAPAAQAASPTLAQFNALKRQVTALKTQVKTLEGALDVAVGCLQTIPVSRYGIDGGTEGYVYQLAPNQVIITGALDLAPPTGTLGEAYTLMITVNNTDCAEVFPSFPRAALASDGEPRTGSWASWGW